LQAAEDAAITAAYRQMSCRVDKVHYPNSTKDVAAVVANYYELAVAVNATVKLRATHRSGCWRQVQEQQQQQHQP
jgi:hypothetical protein